MVLDFQTLSVQEAPEPTEEIIPDPEISTVESGDTYGKFVIEPLEPGFGTTLGNPLRRVLYSSLSGTAITWVKIDGVLHEYTTIPHVKEEVSELLLNIRGIRLRSGVDRPAKLRLEVAGEGEVSAGDIMGSSDFEIVNPELHLASLDSSDAKLSVELNVERGKGYVVAPRADGQLIGVLPVDAIFTPVRKVNYDVEKTRVGQRVDFERLNIEVWTDGSITPIEALRLAANLLVNQFFLFASAQKTAEGGGDGPSRSPIPAEQYNIPVERLELSSRTLNCLKRAGIDKVGEVLELSRPELLRIRNFGEKSYTELYSRLRERELLPSELDTKASEEEPEANAEDPVSEVEPVQVGE